MVTAQVFSGASIGLLLGLLMGLSTSPVVALVVGALAALLGSLVLPAKTGDAAAPARMQAAAWRSTALGLACTGGLFAGLWLRTHDALSPLRPTLAAQVAEVQAAGFGADEARRLVASREFAAAAPAASAASHTPDSHASVLFGQTSSACEQLAPSRFASVAAAADAYDAAGEKALARIARGIDKGLADDAQRRAALSAAVEGLCAAR